MRKKPILTTEERTARRKRIAAAVRAGDSVGQVAVRFGVTRQTVYNACLEYGVPPVKDIRPVRKHASKDHWPEILYELMHTDGSCEMIGERLGVSRARVSQILQLARRAGFKIRK